MSEMAELIPGLPEEIAIDCLIRLHYSAHSVAAQVCRRWRRLLQSKDFYRHRKQFGHTHKAACFIQSFPTIPGSKPAGPLRYGVSVFDPVSGVWERLDPVPYYPDGLPLFVQLASSEGKLVLMGGWDPASYSPLCSVFVYEFATRRWKRGKDMPEDRSFFAAGEVGGRIVVAGGHDRDKNALRTAWAYDVAGDDWTQLPLMTQARDECEGIVIESEFWVVSGYKTESQGEFEPSAEKLELGTSQWRRVEDVWKAIQCPRSCLGIGEDGKLINWATLDAAAAAKVGTCGVQTADWTVVCGAGYEGGTQGFYCKMRGQNGKWERLNVAAGEFTGFVQSGCCVEI